MTCIKCEAAIPAGSFYCNMCGAKQPGCPGQTEEPYARKPKSRGNGQGTVIRRGKTYTAIVTQYAGGRRITKTKGGFVRRRDAIEFIPELRSRGKTAPNITFAALYEKVMELHSSRVSKDTINCYHAAYRYFEPIYFMRFAEVTTEQFQACIDACPKGRRTQENMKALGTLMSKYAMQMDISEKDYAQFVYIGKEKTSERRPFTDEEIQKLFAAVGSVPFVEYIIILIYTGFRINEMLPLTLSDYDAEHRCFIGGEKTEAGRNRIVTVSPKIQPIVDSLIARAAQAASTYIFTNAQGKRMTADNFRKKWMPEALRACGIDDTLTPHNCRHTFATLMKYVDAPETDKMKLIGHTSFEMTSHYTHSDIDSLKAITDHI